MKFNATISLFITYSKVIAAVILVMAFVLDVFYTRNGNVFMFAVPFVVFLISGKQLIDKNKPDVKPDDSVEPK
jgi:hypothetical protein